MELVERGAEKETIIEKFTHSVSKKNKKSRQLESSFDSRSKETPSESEVTNEKENQKFLPQTIKKLDKLRTAYQKGFDEFILTFNKLQGRAAEIYTAVLIMPGHYIKVLSQRSEIPYPTMALYLSIMEQDGLIHKIPAIKKGSYVKQIYPNLTEQVIIDSNIVDETVVCIKGVVTKFKEGIAIDKYQKIEIEGLQEEHVGKNVVIIGIVNKKTNKTTIETSQIKVHD